MNTPNMQQMQEKIAMMKEVVGKWHRAVQDPVGTQEATLKVLLESYKQTDYGKQFNADKVGSYQDYKKAFPVQKFAGFKPYIDKVMAGNTHALLSEEPVVIGFTKGSTGESKVFPFTATQVELFRQTSPRIGFNFTLFKKDFEWMQGYRLNPISSTKVGTIKVGDKEMYYGYSAAVFSKISEGDTQTNIKVVPTQEEIETLPKDPTPENWAIRHEYVFQKARDKNVTTVQTMPDAVIGFAKYIHKKHNIMPKDLWKLKLVGVSGLTGAHSKYAPQIHHFYGEQAFVLEGYSSTEGIFGAQMDDHKGWSPFYDFHFFEVQTIDGIKPMYEMRPGEVGSLIVSTATLPRYRIGDLIMAYEAPYFRCIGREDAPLPPYRYGKI